MTAQYYRPHAAKSAAYRLRRRPQLVNDVLRMALKKYGLDEEISRYEFVLHWKEIVGEPIAAVAQPESFKNGLLTVRVKNSAWAQELTFQKSVILGRLKRYLKHGQEAREIFFRVGKIA